MKKLATDIYNFEHLIERDYLYIDKTEYLWNLIQSDVMYFFARPRRFGKSLTVSTLKAIFQGKRELFKGLAIYDKPYDWKTYPIIHLNFTDCTTRYAKSLEGYLDDAIQAIAAANQITLKEHELSSRFSTLISAMDAGEGVVVLVDEYDKPILSVLNTPESQEVLAVLKGFYSAIKKCEQHERFVFVTGITKFCHVSLFSDLNNLTDISWDANYATMLGYTQEEFENNFAERITQTETLQCLQHSDFLAQIKSWYDGYRFHPRAESVYNPVSLALFFKGGGEFLNYWFETGTPAFLMDLVKRRAFDFTSVLSESIPAFAFNSFEIDDIDPATLLYQTGYLTIRGIEVKYGQTNLWLDFPNREVSESFNRRLLNAYSTHTQREVANFCTHLSDAVSNGDLPKFQKTMEVFFAGIPYGLHHKNEANFQNVFFAIFKLMGFNVHAESQTSDGRIDAIVETDKYIYLFEFKLNKDDSALTQIKEKEYFKPYLLSSKKITLVGANFDTETGRLSDWQHEEIIRG